MLRKVMTLPLICLLIVPNLAVFGGAVSSSYYDVLYNYDILT
jgi:hypothetical protein